MISTDIGIDLGTASILVYVKGKGVVLKEPSVVAFDRDTNKIKAIGEEARLMLGRTPGNIVAVRPLRQGVISDYTVTEKMMKYFIQKAVGKKSFRKPLISVCVPSGVTEVEKKAVEDATFQAGARDVKIIEEPIAAAIGAGIDISRPCGNMIVDIGGGTADIAVISLGGTVVSTSIKIAGDDFDEALVRYMRKKHNLLISVAGADDTGCQRTKPGNRTAEDRDRFFRGDRRSAARGDHADCRCRTQCPGEDTARAGSRCGRPWNRSYRRRSTASWTGRTDRVTYRNQYHDSRGSDDLCCHWNRKICRIPFRKKR